MRLTGLDSNDSHHKRKGEEVINKEDIKDQEPKDIDKKTRLTSTKTSSIINHILTCAISQKHYKNRGFGIFQTGENTQKLAKMLSQNLVQG